MNLSIAIVLMAGVVGAMPADRRAVVLTTDIGAETDDQWALAHLALSPEFDLRGIVTTHATTMLPATPQRTAESRCVAPAPITAPEMHCVVETGKP